MTPKQISLFLALVFSISLPIYGASSSENKDYVLDLLKKASEYEGGLSVQYEVEESYSRDNINSQSKTYSVLNAQF